MKNTKINLDPATYALLIQAKELTGIGRLDVAIGALLLEWTRGEEPPAIAEDMLKGLPDFVLASNKPETKAPEKKKRKPRPPGSTKRRSSPS